MLVKITQLLKNLFKNGSLENMLIDGGSPSTCPKAGSTCQPPPGHCPNNAAAAVAGVWVPIYASHPQEQSREVTLGPHQKCHPVYSCSIWRNGERMHSLRRQRPPTNTYKFQWKQQLAPHQNWPRSFKRKRSSTITYFLLLEKKILTSQAI